MKARTLSMVSGQIRLPSRTRFTSSELPDATLPKYDSLMSLVAKKASTSVRKTWVSAFNFWERFVLMKLTISSLADTSSILYEGRAKISDLEDIAAMADEAWRKRLQDALKQSGRSKREISIKAGKGAGYVHSILSEGKDPTIESLIAVCRELNVSLTW